MSWLSQNPRKRFPLEAARFGLYLLIPVGAVAIYSHPDTMGRLLHMFKFIEYPPEGPKPPSGEEITRMMQEREARRAAAASAASARETAFQASKPRLESDGEKRKRGWFGWLRGGQGRGEEGTKAAS